jgi:hypothetical protein
MSFSSGNISEYGTQGKILLERMDKSYIPLQAFT